MIPLHVLTGFLGAGKTTVLSRLLQDPAAERTAVLVNEVGDLAIDHHLLERIDDDLVALPAGCVCCTLRGELSAALDRVLARRPARIVLETTGLADPAPIVHALAADPRLAATVRLAGVAVVVDGERAEALFAEHAEVRRQLEFADRIVLTKGDRAPQRLAGAHELVRAAAPGCEVREARHGHVDAQWLLAAPPLAALADASAQRLWLHHGGNGAAFRSHAVLHAAPASVELVQLWLRLTAQLDGHRLLRVKGLVECAATGDLFALQSAGHALSPPRRLAVRPAIQGAQIVLIERGLDEATLRQMTTALRAALAGTPFDAPPAQSAVR